MKIFLALLCVCVFCSCSGQQKTKPNSEIIHSTLLKKNNTNNMLQFDISKFRIDNPDEGYKEITTKDSTKINLFKAGKYYHRVTTKKESLFSKIEIFNLRGQIIIEGRKFINDFKIGKWTYYDANGQLVKHDDYDAPFNFSWEEIKKYLHNHETILNQLELEKRKLRISRFKVDDPYWEIEFSGKYKGNKGTFLVNLDGKTGKEKLVKQFIGKESMGQTGSKAAYKILFQENKN